MLCALRCPLPGTGHPNQDHKHPFWVELLLLPPLAVGELFRQCYAANTMSRSVCVRSAVFK